MAIEPLATSPTPNIFQKGQKRFEGTFNTIGNFFRGETGKENRLRDERSADVNAQIKLKESELFSDLEDTASQYKKEQSEISLIETKLSDMDEYDDNFTTTQKLLASKKTSFQQKQDMYYEKLGKYKDVETRNDIIELARNPLTSNFVDDNNATNFINKVVTTPAPTTREQEILRSIELSAVNSIMKNTSALVNEMVREGLVETPDEYYNSGDFLVASKSAISAIMETVGDKPEMYVDNQGNIDFELVYDKVERNPDVAKNLNVYENFMESERERYKKEKHSKVKGLPRLQSWAVRGVDLLRSEGEKTFEMFNTKEGTEKSFGRFGNIDVDNFLRDATYTDTWLKKVGRTVADNPQNALLLTLGALTAIRGGAAVGGLLTRLDGSVKASQALSGLSGGNLGAAKMLQGVKWLARTGGYGAREIAASLPINAVVDSFVNDYDNLGINTFWDLAVGALITPKLPVGDKIVSIANNMPTAGKLKYLRGLLGSGVTEEMVKDTKALETFVNGTIDSIRKNNGAFVAAKDVLKAQVDEGASLGFDFYKQFFGDAVDDFGRILGQDVAGAYGDDIVKARAAIGNDALSEGQKLDVLQTSFKNISDNFISDDLIESVAKIKLNDAIEGAAMRLGETALRNAGVPEGKAKAIAFRLALDPDVDMARIMTDIVADVDDTRKLEVIEAIYEDIINPVLRQPRTVQGKLDALKQIADGGTLGQFVKFDREYAKKIARVEADTGLSQKAKQATREKIIGDIQKDYGDISRGDAEKIYDDIMKYGVKEPNEKIAKFVRDIDRKTGKRLRKVVTDFLRKIPNGGEEKVVESIADFYNELDELNHVGVTRGLTNVAKNMTDVVFTPGFYRAYDEILVSVDQIGTVFGDGFVNFLNVVDPQFMKAFEGGARTVTDLGERHTQYLIDKYMFDPDGLQSYVHFIKDNSLGNKGQKAKLLAQLDLLESTVIEPTYNLIYGMIRNKRSTVGRIDELFADVEINKAREVMQDMLGAKDTAVKAAGGVEVRAPILSVNNAELEAAFRAVMNDFSSPYKRALASGVGVEGDTTYIPNMKEITYKIYEGLKSGKDVDIPAAYLNSEGIRFLDAVFQEQLRIDGYKQVIDKAFEAKKAEFYSHADALIEHFYDEATGVLRPTVDIIDEGDVRTIHLADVLSSIDSRLSDTFAQNTGGVVYSNNLALTRYQILNDYDAFNLKWRDFIGPRLEAISVQDEVFYNTKGFADRMGIDGQGIAFGEQLAESYTKLITDVKVRLKELSKGDLSDEVISDLIHPMYYSFDEYFAGIAKGRAAYDVTDSVVFRLIESKFDKSGLNKALASKMYSGLPNNIKEGFVVVSKGHHEKNLWVTRLSNDFNDFLKMNPQDIPMSEKILDDFLYKTVGYFLVKPTARVNSTSIFDALGGGLVNRLRNMGAKNTAKIEDIVGGMKAAGQKGEKAKVASLQKELQSILPKKMRDDIAQEVGDYVAALADMDSQKARAAVMPSVSDFLKKNVNRELDILEKGYTSTSDVLVNSMKNAEARAELKSGYLVRQEQLHEQILLDYVQNEVITGAASGYGNKSVGEVFVEKAEGLINAMGIDKFKARELLTNRGVNDEVLDLIFSQAGGKAVDEEAVIRAVASLINDGDVTPQVLLRNKYFRNSFNKIQEGYMNSHTPEMMREQLGFWLPGIGRFGKKVAKSPYINNNGKLTEHLSESYGRIMENVFKSVLTLNSRSLYDTEVADIIEDVIAKKAKGKIYKPKMLYNGNEMESLGINTYLANLRDNMNALIKAEGFDLTDMKEVAKKAFSGDYKDKRSLVSVFSAKGEERKRKLFDMLYDYRVDISGYRRQGGTEDGWLPNIAMFTEARTLPEFMSAMSGMRVNLNNKQIDRMIKKYAYNEKNNLRLLNGILGGFERDIVYGGLFTTTKGDWTQNLLSKSYLFFQYNIASGLPVGLQQLINNNIHAYGFKHAFGPSVGLDEFTQSKFVRELLGFNLLLGRRADIAMGQPGARQAVLDNFLQQSSALYQADAISMTPAVQSSFMQGLAPIYDAGGEELLSKTIQKIKDIDEFSTKYGVEAGKFQNKGWAKNYLSNYALDNGLNPDALINEYLTHLRTYNNELAPIMSRTRAALGAFFVTDNMREFGSVRIVDQGANRMFFVLKKWAIGKSGEYAYRLANEVGGNTMGEVIRNMKDSNTLKQIGVEMAQFLRMGRLAQRASGGEYTAADFAYAMAVPSVVLAMLILDPAISGGQRFQDYRQGGEDPFTAAVAGASEFINELGGTMFLYQNWTVSKLEQSFDSASAYDDTNEQLGVFFGTFLNNLMLRMYGKISPSYKGVKMNSMYDGSVTTDMIEWVTNTESTAQKSVREKVDTAFAARRIANGGGVAQVLGYAISDNPVGRLLQKATGLLEKGSDTYGNHYIPTLARTLDKYVDEKGLYLLTKPSINGAEEKERLYELIDNYEDHRMLRRIASEMGLEGEKFVARAKKGDVTRTEVEEMFARVGYTADGALWTDVKNALKFQGGFSEELGGMYEPKASKAEIQALSQEFLDFVETNEINLTNEETALSDFINARGELGSNYIFSDYMAAYDSGLWKIITEKHDLGDKYNVFKTGGAKVDEYLPGAASSPEYLAAVNEYQDVLKNELFNTWDVVMGENPYIGIMLKEKYISEATDVPIAVSGVLSDYIFVKDVQDALRDDGYMSDEFMNYMNYVNRSISKGLKYADGSPEDKENAVNMMLRNANAILETTEDMAVSSTEEASMKAGLAYGMSAITEELLTLASQDEYKKFSDATKSAAEGFVDALTGSSPTSLKTALEFATGKNFSGGEGGKGKKVPQSKGNWGKQYDKIELAVNRVRSLGLKINSNSNGFKRTALPEMKRSHRNVKIALADFNLDDIVLDKGSVTRETNIQTPKPSDTTEKLKINKKSVSSSKKTKRSPKKIKSFKA